MKPNKQQISFAQFIPLCLALGIEVIDVGHAEATLTLPYSKKIIGDPKTGVIHGGAVSTLLDSASGLAVYMHPDSTSETATIDLRIDYMRSAPAGHKITARAEVYHTTHTVAFLRASAWADDPDNPIAQATGAFVFTKRKTTS